MSLDDFCGLYTEEFTAICKAWRQQQETQQQDEWERMRILAAITIQPHTKSKLTPQKLLPLPWDNKRKHSKQTDAPKLTKEQRRARYEELLHRLGDD